MSLALTPRKVLGSAEVYQKTGLSRRTVYRLLKTGRFPQPFSLPGVRKRVWLKSTIDVWIDEAVAGPEEKAA